MSAAKTPRFKQGQIKGELQVMRILEHGKRHLKDAQWWYLVECECGSQEEICQNALAVRNECVECSKEIRAAKCSKSSIPCRQPTDIEMLALHRRWK